MFGYAPALSSSTFPGEKWFQVYIPDYEIQYIGLSLLFIASLGLLMLSLAAPWLLYATEEYEIRRIDNNIPKESSKVQIKKVRRSRWYSYLLVLAGPPIWVCFSRYFLLHLVPNNSFMARRVLQVPVMYEDECKKIVESSIAAAARNYEKALKESEKYDYEYDDDEEEEEEGGENPLLKEPHGWQKSRHANYPTTDLNLIADPFTSEDRKWIRGLLNRRLAPILSRLYGVPVTALRAKDFFVVRYQATGQNGLPRHMDDGDLTVNILLNNEFVGNGTRVYNRHTRKPFAVVQPDAVGNMLTHHAALEHEGIPIDEGLRFILVVFIEVDRILDGAKSGPFTGASPFTTWLNLNWIFSRVLSWYKANEDTLQAFGIRFKINRWIGKFQLWVDKFEPHVVETVVHNSDRNAFLKSLDDAYMEDDTLPKARWVEKQELNSFLKMIQGSFRLQDEL